MVVKKRKATKTKAKVPAKKRKATPAKAKAPAKKRKATLAKAKAPAKKRKATPAKAKAPAKKRKAAPDLHIPELPSGPTVQREMISSNWNQHFEPESLTKIFVNVLEGHAKNSPFEPSDILIFNHGLMFLGHERLDVATTKKLSSIANKSGFRLAFADVKAGTELYVFMGDKMKTQDSVVHSFETRKNRLNKIAKILSAHWVNFDWWLWFEIEESLYE